MKKIISFVLVFLLMMSFVVYAQETVKTDEFLYMPDGVFLTHYGNGYINVPSVINGTPILKIGEMAFSGFEIDGAFIDDGIEIIGDGAFEGCTLDSVSIPETVKKIGSRAFADCESLAEVFIYGTPDIDFGAESFYGTGKLYFYIDCRAGEKDIREKLQKAKGDDNFEIEIMHDSLVESDDQKDVYGINMLVCENCDFMGSRYYADESMAFDDVSEDDWFYPYVLYTYSMGIVKGKGEGRFDPEGNMTCAEAVKLASLIHSLQTDGELIEESGKNWYDAYVSYCNKVGIIEEDVSLSWEEPITRGEMAYLFSRCDIYPDYINEVPLTDIPDVDEKTPFAVEIHDLYNKGVAVGDEYMAFKPDSPVKRSEAVSFISRIVGWEMRIELPKG